MTVSGYAAKGGQFVKGAIVTCDSIGKWLTKERTQRGLSMSQVAELAGVCKSTIVRIETEQQPPSLWTVEQICAAFGKRIAIIDGNK